MTSNHNQEAQVFLVGNQTLQNKTRKNKLVHQMQKNKAYYTYKHSGDTMQRLNAAKVTGLMYAAN